MSAGQTSGSSSRTPWMYSWRTLESNQYQIAKPGTCIPFRECSTVAITGFVLAVECFAVVWMDEQVGKLGVVHAALILAQPNECGCPSPQKGKVVLDLLCVLATRILARLGQL